MRPLTTALAAATITAGVSVCLAVPAAADVEPRGMCSAASAWEADIERDFGVYDIDFEVKTQVVGERWRLVLQQNGRSVYSDTRATVQDVDGRYADVDWEIVRPDRAGTSERFILSARNISTGETCRTALRG